MSTTIHIPLIPHAIRPLLDRLRERLKHNTAYLAQRLPTRLATSALTYGQEMSEAWMRGEQEAIIAENEWIEALLKDFGGDKP